MSKRMTAAEAKFISRTIPRYDQRQLDQLIDGILGLIQKEAACGERFLKFNRLGFGLSRDKYSQEQKLAIDELVSLGYGVTYNVTPADSPYEDYSITISWE